MRKGIVKKSFAISLLVLTLLGFFVMGGIASLTTRAEGTTSNTAERTLTVNGMGVLKVKPDTCIINIGVITSNKDSRIAQQENTKASNEVIAALKKLGIKEDEMKTVSYNMYREYYFDNKEGTRKEGDYKVINTVEVTIKNIDKAGEVIDAATMKGANQINNIRFTVLDTDHYYQEALKKAIENASGKANVMAQTLGIKIGKPTKVVEVGAQEPVIYKEMMAYDMIESRAAAPAVPISSGELEIRAYVHLTYSY